MMKRFRIDYRRKEIDENLKNNFIYELNRSVEKWMEVVEIEWIFLPFLVVFVNDDDHVLLEF
jgi:hypothetical protein